MLSLPHKHRLLYWVSYFPPLFANFQGGEQSQHLYFEIFPGSDQKASEFYILRNKIIQRIVGIGQRYVGGDQNVSFLSYEI